MSRAALVLLAAGALACGRVDSSSGTVKGFPLEPSSAGLVNTANDLGRGFTTVIVSSLDDICKVGKDQTLLNGSQGLWLNLAITADGGELVPIDQAGEYAIGDGDGQPGSKIAAAEFQTYRICGIAIDGKATSGSVGILHLEVGANGLPSRVVGTFSLSFPSGDQLTGQFDSALCSQFGPELAVCL